MRTVALTRDPIQAVRAEAVGYGAKDTGEMGGGAAAAILQAAGPEILTDLRTKLATSGPPYRLREGVTSAIRAASRLGVRSMAFSALGTGESRVEPRTAATLMLNGVRDYFQTEPNADVTMMLCLPTYRDYEAFSAVVQG